MSYVDRAISPNVWLDLLRDVSDEEIQSTLFSIGDDKALGPDGFTVKFFIMLGILLGRILLRLFLVFSSQASY